MAVAENKALSGVRVIDLSRILAGPYCGQLLADFGADVIKVEGPDGDDNRAWPPIAADGNAVNFASVNRGKRGMVLDLKNPGAKDILLRLARKADVLVHSFPPDTAARLGISQSGLRAENPRLIVATISGYGAEGPLAEKRGYDLMAQAFGGIMSTTGEPGGPPLRCGASIIDMTTGIALYAAVVTALVRRATTGQGTWVHASLLETAVSMLGHFAVAWMQAGVLPEPQGSGSSVLAPYQAFRCQDGLVLAGAPNDAAWIRFCEALESPDLAADPRFQGNMARVQSRDTLVPILEERFLRRPAAYWLERLEARNVACAPIQSIDQVMAHPQVLANAMQVHVRDTAGAVSPVVGTPFKVSDGGGFAETTAPGLGQDIDSVLSDWLGLGESDVRTFRAAGAFGTANAATA